MLCSKYQSKLFYLQSILAKVLITASTSDLNTLYVKNWETALDNFVEQLL